MQAFDASVRQNSFQLHKALENVKKTKKKGKKGAWLTYPFIGSYHNKESRQFDD